MTRAPRLLLAGLMVTTGTLHFAAPDVFGHGGAGTSYSWADAQTGVSFTYLTNTIMAEPAHSARLDIVSTMAHAAVASLSGEGR